MKALILAAHGSRREVSNEEIRLPLFRNLSTPPSRQVRKRLWCYPISSPRDAM